MRADSVIYLISVVPGKNSIGDPLQIESEPRKVFAEKKSVRQSEFYQAAATGLKPELAFDVWSIDYNNEKKLMHKGNKYSIIRTFSKGEKVEIICSRGVSHAIT